MPFAVDPNQTYPYVFSTDRQLPEAERPTLLFYFPTCKETKQIAKLLDEADTVATVEQRLNIQCDAIRIILADWKNIKNRKGEVIPFNPENLHEFLSSADLGELKVKLLHDLTITELNKKKAALSVQSSLDNSVANVTTVSA